MPRAECPGSQADIFSPRPTQPTHPRQQEWEAAFRHPRPSTRTSKHRSRTSRRSLQPRKPAHQLGRQHERQHQRQQPPSPPGRYLGGQTRMGRRRVSAFAARLRSHLRLSQGGVREVLFFPDGVLPCRNWRQNGSCRCGVPFSSCVSPGSPVRPRRIAPLGSPSGLRLRPCLCYVPQAAKLRVCAPAHVSH